MLRYCEQVLRKKIRNDPSLIAYLFISLKILDFHLSKQLVSDGRTDGRKDVKTDTPANKDA